MLSLLIMATIPFFMIRDIILGRSWLLQIQNIALFLVAAWAFVLHQKDQISSRQSHHWSTVIYVLVLMKSATLVLSSHNPLNSQLFVAFHIIASFLTISRRHYVLNASIGAGLWAVSLRSLGLDPWSHPAYIPTLIGGAILFVIHEHHIMDAVRARLDMKRNHENTRAFLELAQCFIHHVDHEGRLLYVNSYWRRKLGYSEEEIQSLTLADIMSTGREVIQSISSNDTVNDPLSMLISKSGQQIHVEGAVHLIVHPDGKRVIQGIYIDRTEREKVLRKLKASESRFRSLAEHVQEAFWLYDIGCRKMLYVNPAIEKLTGYGADEWMANSDAILRRITPGKAKRPAKTMDDLCQNEDARTEYRFCHRDGTERWASLQTTRIVSAGGCRQVIGLSMDITAAKLHEKEIEAISRLDALTGIANRRAFDETILREVSRHARQRSFLALLMIDLDYFKAFNDMYGHLKGDRCLRQVCGAAARQLRRPADLLCRYGGEEFAVILPDTGVNGACAVAERIRRGIEDLGIMHGGSPIGHVTVSVGVASFIPAPHSEAEDLIRDADQGLYCAKENGRNRIEIGGRRPVPLSGRILNVPQRPNLRAIHRMPLPEGGIDD